VIEHLKSRIHRPMNEHSGKSWTLPFPPFEQSHHDLLKEWYGEYHKIAKLLGRTVKAVREQVYQLKLNKEDA